MVTIATTFIHSFTHSFNTNYWASYSVLGVVGTGDVIRNKTKKIPALMELHSSGDTDNKQESKQST